MIVCRKPINSSSRGLSIIDKSNLWKGRPFKGLTSGINKTGGRNNRGIITTRHIGGGNKVRFRQILFNPRKLLSNDSNTIQAVVTRIEYDPMRSAFIALCKLNNNDKESKCFFYILAASELKINDKVIISNTSVHSVLIGSMLMLRHIPVGTTICSIESSINRGMSIARSAGMYANLIKKDNEYALIKLRNGLKIKVSLDCFAMIGAISNDDHKNRVMAKAGRNRWLGIRPTVRGVAMNPIDHPHGGGNGKSKGSQPTSPWGLLTKGKKTIKKNKR